MAESQSTMADEELVLRACGGDVGAFECLVERHFGMVYAIAYVRMRHRETAEDLVQEVFLSAFLHLDAVREPARFPAWLGQVTRNLAFQWLKRQRRASCLVAMVPLDGIQARTPNTHAKEARAQMEDQESIEAVRNAIFQLPAEQAEAVLLRFGEDLKPPAVAKRLGLHPTTVRRRLKKALAAMKESLPPILGEVTPFLLPAHEIAIRTVRMVDAVALLSPVERSALGRLSAGGSAKGVWATAMPLRSFYYWAYDTTPGRIVMPASCEQRRYDITLEASEPGLDAKHLAMQRLLAHETGLSARWETREEDVYVLTAREQAPAGLREPGPLPKGWWSFAKLDSTQGSECRNARLVWLVTHLEENLDRPVVDETGLTGEYDWDATWAVGASADAIAQAVRRLGLDLTTARRAVDMLVLEEG
jgi:RNA polymerase sigma-70 factor, ECF subfamily